MTLLIYLYGSWMSQVIYFSLAQSNIHSLIDLIGKKFLAIRYLMSFSSIYKTHCTVSTQFTKNSSLIILTLSSINFILISMIVIRLVWSTYSIIFLMNCLQQNKIILSQQFPENLPLFILLFFIISWHMLTS